MEWISWLQFPVKSLAGLDWAGGWGRFWGQVIPWNGVGESESWQPKATPQKTDHLGIYPLVNIQKTEENHHC